MKGADSRRVWCGHLSSDQVRRQIASVLTRRSPSQIAMRLAAHKRRLIREADAELRRLRALLVKTPGPVLPRAEKDARHYANSRLQRLIYRQLMYLERRGQSGE